MKPTPTLRLTSARCEAAAGGWRAGEVELTYDPESRIARFSNDETFRVSPRSEIALLAAPLGWSLDRWSGRILGLVFAPISGLFCVVLSVKLLASIFADAVPGMGDRSVIAYFASGAIGMALWWWVLRVFGGYSLIVRQPSETLTVQSGDLGALQELEKVFRR